ncbi:MAG: serpin family protein [Nannocystaceae bacterium]
MTPPPEVDPADATTLAHAIDDFAIDLYRKLGSADANAIVSPASIALAFAMLQAGARGKTASELARVFHTGDDAAAHQGAVAAALARWNAPSEDVTLQIANRLFGDDGVAFDPAYLELGARVFGAALEPMPMRKRPDDARKRINAWVEQQTRERIRDLLPAGSLDESARLVLVNAIYFKANWSDPFDKGQTRKRDFFAPKGKRSAMMMHRTGHMTMARHDGATLVELPYGYGRYGLTVVLPDQRDGLAALERTIDRAWFERARAGATGERVALALPKFRIEAPEPLRLRALLQRLGLVEVFGPHADLTGIAAAKEQLQVSEAFHKAFIALDEDGTEAAAATAIGVKAGAAPAPAEPIPVVVDHPFVFALRDSENDTILFMGRVVDPTA